jgi:pimeloyl-ACP methyl ester carboxylesterase
VPGLDRALARAAPAVFRPSLGVKLSARANPEAANLVRHAFKDVSGNSNRARSWAKLARHWPMGVQLDLLDAYERLDAPVLLLWADEDRMHSVAIADDALARLPDGQLRVLDGTGFLMAYDDPVGVVRELVAFCR